jgi:hypothetical protein
VEAADAEPLCVRARALNQQWFRFWPALPPDDQLHDGHRDRQLAGHDDRQLLSGVNPMDAVKYQIVILFLIASGTALGTVGVVLLSFRRLFNRSHQFQSRLLISAK